MSDVNRLPREFANSFRRAASASEAVLNLMEVYRPCYNTVYTNFLGDALTAEWAAAKTNGACAAVTVASGLLTMTTGTACAGYAGQGFGTFWTGDNGFYMETMQSLDTLTTSKIEVGITDSTADAGAVNAKATPTATAGDFAVLIRDTTDNTCLDLISIMSCGCGASADAEGVFTVAAGTDFRVEVRLQNNTAAFFINGSNVGSSAIEGGTSITPWWFAQARAGCASRVLTANYLFATGPNGVAIP